MPAKVPGNLTPDGRVAGEAADVHLVDDQVLDRHLQRPVALPVEVVEDEPAAVRARARSSPACAPQTSRPPMARGVGVEQDLRRVEAVAAAAGRTGRPCGSRTRCSRSRGRRRSWRRHCRCGTRSGNGISTSGSRAAPFSKSTSVQAVAWLREDREVDAARHEGGPERERLARAELVALRIRGSDRHRCVAMRSMPSSRVNRRCRRQTVAR